MASSTILNQIIILFLIMLIGFYAKKKDIITGPVSKKLSELLLLITSPMLVISSFQVNFSSEMFKNVTYVFIFAVAAHTLSILLGIILYRRYPENKRKILKFASIYSNCGYMGFPLLDSLFGKPGVLYGSVYVAAFNIFLWTNGVMLFSKDEKLNIKTLKKSLLNPGIVSVIIGLVLFIFSVGLPFPVAKTLEMVGSMTSPLSMLIVGASLTEVDFRRLLHGFELYYVSAVRLILIPVCTCLILKLFRFEDTLLSICTLLVAMPVAAVTTIFSEMYGGDTALASRLVAFSTLASIVTIPLIMLLV